MFKDSADLYSDYFLDRTEEQEYIIKEKLLAVLNIALLISLIGVSGIVCGLEFKQTHTNNAISCQSNNS
ncbi:MAG: hypothetical protein ACFBSE_04005 [Prochloraceae cyanobacterium]